MSFFELDNEGVWFLSPPTKKETDPEKIWICSPLKVIAITRDDNNENFGKLLKFHDLDGILHQWSVPAELLIGDGIECAKILSSMGLQIGIGKKIRDHLISYIQTTTPALRMRCVVKLGWYEKVYVLSKEVLGQTIEKEKIVFQSPNPIGILSQAKGDLLDWQNKVSSYCVGNSLLGFAISAAFVGPLLHLLDEENGGFHFRGQSSIGKTTLLKIASSVYGSKKMIQTWRATTNGLEAIAAQHNDSLLCLDELAQLDAKEAGSIAYLLCNGAGKQRANKCGISRNRQCWRLIFLSTGEIGFPDHIRQSGQRVRGGQEVRVVDISVDTGKYGIFENLHGFESGDIFSRALCNNIDESYGTAGRVFINLLTQDIEKAITRVKSLIKEFLKNNHPSNANGQVLRVLHKFSLVAAAGTLATEMGITGWSKEEAFWGTSECLNLWLKRRGGTSAQETKEILLQVRLFFEQHGDSRFAPFEEESFKTINRVGYKKEIAGELNYYVFPESFTQNICQGFDAEIVGKILIEKGWLVPDSEGKSSRPVRLPCSKIPMRCYHFKGDKVFSDEI